MATLGRRHPRRPGRPGDRLQRQPRATSSTKVRTLVRQRPGTSWRRSSATTVARATASTAHPDPGAADLRRVRPRPVAADPLRGVPRLRPVDRLRGPRRRPAGRLPDQRRRSRSTAAVRPARPDRYLQATPTRGLASITGPFTAVDTGGFLPSARPAVHGPLPERPDGREHVGEVRIVTQLDADLDSSRSAWATSRSATSTSTSPPAGPVPGGLRLHPDQGFILRVSAGVDLQARTRPG